jgi:hypothetical protein
MIRTPLIRNAGLRRQLPVQVHHTAVLRVGLFPVWSGIERDL